MISPETTTRPVLTSVSQATRPERVVAQHRVEHAVGDLVGDLVRVALGHRLGGEQVLVVGKRGHGIWSVSSAVVSVSPLVDARPTARILARSARSASNARAARQSGLLGEAEELAEVEKE